MIASGYVKGPVSCSRPTDRRRRPRAPVVENRPGKQLSKSIIRFQFCKRLRQGSGHHRRRSYLLIMFRWKFSSIFSDDLHVLPPVHSDPLSEIENRNYCNGCRCERCLPFSDKTRLLPLTGCSSRPRNSRNARTEQSLSLSDKRSIKMYPAIMNCSYVCINSPT